MNGDSIAALIVGFGAVLTGIAALWAQQRGTRTDSTSSAVELTNAASGLVRELRNEISSLRDAVADLRNLVAALETEIVTLGGDPHRIRLQVAERRRSTDRIEGTPI